MSSEIWAIQGFYGMPRDADKPLPDRDLQPATDYRQPISATESTEATEWLEPVE